MNQVTHYIPSAPYLDNPSEEAKSESSRIKEQHETIKMQKLRIHKNEEVTFINT